MGSRQVGTAARSLRPWQGAAIELAVLLFAGLAVGVSAQAFALRSPAAIGLLVGGLALLAGVGGTQWWRERAGAETEPAPAVPAVASPATWRLRTTVRDEPGGLAALTARFAERDVNILALQVHPSGADVVDEFLVSAPGTLSAERIRELAVAGGGRDVFVARADLHELVDVPTRMLAVAGRLGRGPEALVDSLRMVLGEVRAIWARPDGDPEQGSAEQGGGRMVLAVGRRALVLTRDVPFTASEGARARSLVDLDRRLSHADAVTRRNPDSTLGVRQSPRS